MKTFWKWLGRFALLFLFCGSSAFVGYIGGILNASARYRSNDQQWARISGQANYYGCLMGITATNEDDSGPSPEMITWCRKEKQYFEGKLQGMASQGGDQ